MRGQQPFVSLWARDDLELNMRNMKGLRAEFATIDTPRIAWNMRNICHLKNKDLTDLENLTPLLLTILVDDNLLPDELIHNVGKVGQQEGQNHRHG